MRLRFSRRSVRDLARIADYIRPPRRVRTAILDSLQILISFPRAGRRQRLEGVRKHVTRPYSYIVYYVIDDTAGEVRIVTIQHPAQEREQQDA